MEKTYKIKDEKKKVLQMALTSRILEIKGLIKVLVKLESKSVNSYKKELEICEELREIFY